MIYCKNPEYVDAIQWKLINLEKVIAFLTGSEVVCLPFNSEIIVKNIPHGLIIKKPNRNELILKSNGDEGLVLPGDYIVKCPGDTFIILDQERFENEHTLIKRETDAE